jgi:hypothetical protein
VSAFDAAVQDMMIENDCIAPRAMHPRSDMWVYVYLSIKTSPLLVRNAYYQSALGLLTFRYTDGYLLYYDSYGQQPEVMDQFPRPPVMDLQKLFGTSGSRLSSVSLSNTDLGPSAVRRRSVHARAIGDLGPALSDHAFMMTTADGAYETTDPDGHVSTRARYVGFTRSRVSDRREVPYPEYIEWQDEIVTSLRGLVAQSALFDRFAEAIDRPDDVTPENILLDIVPSDFVDLDDEDRTELVIEDLSLPVEEGVFVCRANGDDYDVQVVWNVERRKYILSSTDLDRRFVRPEGLGGQSRTLLGHINREQAFRIVPRCKKNDYSIYANGRFFRPRLPLGSRSTTGNPELLRLLIPCSTLATIANEKGRPESAGEFGWESGSLFHLIDTLGSGSGLEFYMTGIDLLVCDDAGANEIADFLALASTNRRVIAIHAKVPAKYSPLSASVLHEVSSQAVKSLGWIQPYFIGMPPNIAKWREPWRASGIGEVPDRLRLGTGTPTEVWDRFRSALQDPQWTREIWIVVGNGPSVSQLDEERRASDIKAHVVQLLYLLQSTWDSVQSVGNTLRVFTSA